MAIHELELPDRLNEEETAFSSLLESFRKFKEVFYPELRGLPEREFMSLGARLVLRPAWERPDGLTIDGIDVADKILPLVTQKNAYTVHVEKYDLDLKRTLPYRYSIVMEPNSYPMFLMKVYLPTQRGITDCLGDIRLLRAVRMLDIAEIFYLTGCFRGYKTTPENILLTIIRKDPVLSLRFVGWILDGLAKAEKVIPVEQVRAA